MIEELNLPHDISWGRLPKVQPVCEVVKGFYFRGEKPAHSPNLEITAVDAFSYPSAFNPWKGNIFYWAYPKPGYHIVQIAILDVLLDDPNLRDRLRTSVFYVVMPETVSKEAAIADPEAFDYWELAIVPLEIKKDSKENWWRRTNFHLVRQVPYEYVARLLGTKLVHDALRAGKAF
jgi:hypothetical protein